MPLAVLLSMAMLAVENPRQLTRIQFWSMGTSTRIAIEFDSEFQYKADRLEKPGRIFFDLAKTAFSLEGKTKGLYSVPVGDKLVKQIRVANPAGGTATRVVLDLEGEALYTAAVLQNPHRLMIDVFPPGQVPAPGDAPGASGDVSVTAAASAVVENVVAPLRVSSTPPPPVVRVPETMGSLDRAPLPAAANSGGDRSLTRALGLKLRRVVIDPGHGGFDVGTSGHNGLKEKDLVLDVSLRLGAMVKEKLQLEVIYTRDNDSFVALERRAEIANERKADLFISIHANSSTVRSVTGVETYYLSVSGTKASMEVAARENAASQKSMSELSSVLQQIAMNDKIRESVEFAGRVQYAMVTHTGPPGARARNRGVRRAPFIVLIGAKMPAILAEIGFVSNAQDEAEMGKPEYREKIAEAVYAGIEEYAQSLSKYQTAASVVATNVAAKPVPAAAAAVVKPVVTASAPTRRVATGKPSPTRRHRGGASN